jgi:hypothetical protein
LAKFQSPRAITRPKIIGPERNINLICNSSLYTHIPNIKSISPSIRAIARPKIIRPERNVNDLIFGIWVYNDELQIDFTFGSGPMIFGRVMALGLWNLAKYLVVTTLFHYDLRYWLDFRYESITDQLWNSFVILSLLLRELKKDETFPSLLNIYGGDIRVVLTHLVSLTSLWNYFLHFSSRFYVVMTFAGQISFSVKLAEDDLSICFKFLIRP